MDNKIVAERREKAETLENSATIHMPMISR